MDSFIKSWSEGLEPMGMAAPVAPESPVGPVPPEEPVAPQEPEQPGIDPLEVGEDLDDDKPEKKSSGAGPVQGDDNEGVRIGNLGAQIVGTLNDWMEPQSGFLATAKNQALLDEGIDSLLAKIGKFNQAASRLAQRGTVESRDLRNLQRPWMLTLGVRLGALKSSSTEDKDKAKMQLTLLAPRIEQQWNRFIETNKHGIRVTNPSIMEPPGSPVEEEPQAEAPAPAAEPMMPEEMPPASPPAATAGMAGTGF